MPLTGQTVTVTPGVLVVAITFPRVKLRRLEFATDPILDQVAKDAPLPLFVNTTHEDLVA